MKMLQKRLAVLLLAAALTGRPGALVLPCGAEETSEQGNRQTISAGSHGTVFAVLGISFLCAGGVAVLLAVWEP